MCSVRNTEPFHRIVARQRARDRNDDLQRAAMEEDAGVTWLGRLLRRLGWRRAEVDQGAADLAKEMDRTLEIGPWTGDIVIPPGLDPLAAEILARRLFDGNGDGPDAGAGGVATAGEFGDGRSVDRQRRVDRSTARVLCWQVA